MRSISALLCVFLFISCSSDSTETEPVNQQDDEVVIEEMEDENEDEMGEEQEESFKFPFSVSVVLKDFSNPVQREGVFLSIDFTKNATAPNQAINVTAMASLDLDAGIIDNGQENILIFVQKAGTAEKEYITYDLDTGVMNSVFDSALLIDSENCFFNGTHITANASNIFAFNYDLCSEDDGLIPISWDNTLNTATPLPTIERSFTGDTPHRIWANSNYFIVHFDDRRLDNPGESIIGEGIFIYDAVSLELIYETRTEERKIPLLDNNKLIVRKGSTLLDLIDLESGQTLFSNEVSNADGLVFESRINNADIHEDRVGLLVFDFDELEVYPGVYDFRTNSSVVFDSEAYGEYFRTSGLPVPNPIRQSKDYVFDLESETFTVLYHGFTQGIIQENNPDFIGLVYMNFDGEILYEYEFEKRPWLEQVMVKR